MTLSTIKLLALASLSAVAAQLTATDTTVLNFAYNLELLEATYYKCALTGVAYTTAQLGAGPAAPVVTGCAIVPDLADSATYGKLAAAILADELAHVKALRATLGYAAAQSPALDISAATFNTLFQTAMYADGVPDGAETFDPYANELNWALGAFIFEDVGVTAYLGAAAGLNSTAVLKTAAALMGTEAYHAGAVREMLLRVKGDTINDADDSTFTVEQAANKISDLRASLSTDGEAADDVGIAEQIFLARKRSLVSNDDQNTWVPTDDNAFTFSRTAAQVIKIVTFGAEAGTGGFFPAGLSLTAGTASPTQAPTTAPPTATTPAPSTPSSSTPTPTTAAASTLGFAWSSVFGAALIAAKLLM